MRLFSILSGQSAREVCCFGSVGVIGFAVDYTIAYVCVVLLHLHPMLARIFSFAGAVTATWILNRKVTFRRRAREGANRPGLVPYAIGMLGGLLVNYAVYWGCLTLLQNVEVALRLLAAIAAGSLAGMVVNFILCDRFLFRRT